MILGVAQWLSTKLGWDVSITNDGPELLERNHDWCKLLWQLPVKKGLKQELIPYLKELT